MFLVAKSNRACSKAESIDFFKELNSPIVASATNALSLVAFINPDRKIPTSFAVAYLSFESFLIFLANFVFPMSAMLLLFNSLNALFIPAVV